MSTRIWYTIVDVAYMRATCLRKMHPNTSKSRMKAIHSIKKVVLGLNAAQQLGSQTNNISFKLLEWKANQSKKLRKS